MRTTPENIIELQPNEIFVFGSNESGRHGRGAAKTALKWGAKWGKVEGIQGRTYGIPTKNASITKTLPVNTIKVYVDRFISYAKCTPSLTFLVTEIGCGLAGLSPKGIAPLFKECVNMSNVVLPARFLRLLTSPDNK